MGDDQHGHAALGEGLHDAQHLAHHFGVQGGGGLIKEQDLRVHGHGTGDGDTLLLTAGDLPGPGVDVGGHAHLLQVLHGVGAGLLTAALEYLDLACHAVFQHGHVVEEVEGLKHHPHMGAVGGGVGPARQDVSPVIENFTRCGGLQEIDAAQQRGLAGAGGADNADHVARVHREVDIPQDPVGPEGLGQMVDAKNTLVHVSSHLRAYCRGSHAAGRRAGPPGRLSPVRSGGAAFPAAYS